MKSIFLKIKIKFLYTLLSHFYNKFSKRQMRTYSCRTNTLMRSTLYIMVEYPIFDFGRKLNILLKRTKRDLTSGKSM